MLELRDVIKLHRSGGSEVIRAVDGVSLTVAPGNLVALYGPSGSGKTTLLELVAALHAPDDGQILAAGRDVTRLTRRDAARYRLLDLGFVRQTFDLLPAATALDNAALKLFNTGIGVRNARRRVIPILERLGLQGQIERRAEQLSHGEKQRVMLARALSTDPKLLLADEPTGSLDSERTREVLELLVELCHERNVATLLVTHDPRAAAFADAVHALHDGRLVAHDSGAVVSPSVT